MMFWARILGAVLGATLLLSTPAAAQRRDEQVATIGNVAIMRVFDNNRFNRCYAWFGRPELGARIFYTTDRNYIITVPAVQNTAPVNADVMIPGGRIALQATNTGGANGRSIIQVTGRQAEQMLAIRGALVVVVDGVTFRFPLQGTTMEDVFVRTENCVTDNERRR